MTRIAWFSPLPPVRSGIAQYSRELLAELSRTYTIEVYESRNAHDFLWKHRERPYQLIVYQLGNAPCHDYMWAYLVRYPGLVVLHDGQLHHARGRMLLQQWHQQQDEYRREFGFNHPDANPDLAQLGAAGLLGSLTYLWPMLRAVVESSRRILVHNHWLAGQIREAHPGTVVDVVEMGVPESAPRKGARQAIRARHGIAEDAIVFAAFGKVTPEKRVREALRASASIAKAAPHAHVLVAGETVEYYDLRAEAQALGIDEKVTIAGYVADEDIDDYLAASDVCLSMRWPTSRETSASWLRCLAAGKPTISTDLVHTVDIPTLDPRNWTVLKARLTTFAKATAVRRSFTRRRKPRPADMVTTDPPTTDADRAQPDVHAEPVGVSVDILDEDHSLGLAMRRLATDASLRATLGGNAHALWNARFRLDAMAAGYARVIRESLEGPLPDVAALALFPVHFRSGRLEHAEHLLGEAGFPAEVIADLWTREHD